MKRLLTIFAMVCMALSAAAQDEVVDRSQKKYDCFITREDSSAVYFRYDRDGMKVDTMIERGDIFNYRYNITYSNETPGINKKVALTVGLFEGGASTVGVEWEILMCKRIGWQVGVGFCGASTGVNFHFFPTIRSSYASIELWYTGFADNSNYFLGHKNMVVGPSVTYRNVTGWFTGTFGIGYVIETGNATPDWQEDFPVGIKLSLGAYFPL